MTKERVRWMILALGAWSMLSIAYDAIVAKEEFDHADGDRKARQGKGAIAVAVEAEAKPEPEEGSDEEDDFREMELESSTMQGSLTTHSLQSSFHSLKRHKDISKHLTQDNPVAGTDDGFVEQPNNGSDNQILNQHRPSQTQTHSAQRPLPIRNYVVLSSTIEKKHHVERKPSDYDFLAPVAALNWYHKAGFVPIIVLVSCDLALVEIVRELWKIILPSEAIVVPVIVDGARNSTVVTMGQTIRHYASLLLPQLNDESYLRLTDADMFILDREPFLPYNQTDIDVFNGGCCGANENKTVQGFRDPCRYYPKNNLGLVPLFLMICSVREQL